MKSLIRRIARGPSSRIAVILASLLAVGCVETEEDVANGDDPLRALTVAHPSDRYGSTYWTQKSDADSALWAQAVAYCEGRADGDHPNCDAVRQVQVIKGMSDMPEDRPNEFRLTVPQDTSGGGSRR
jgi:hypothetical protein